MEYRAEVLFLKVRDLISDTEEPYRWGETIMVDWLNEAQASMFEAHPEFYYVDSVVVDPPDSVTTKDSVLKSTQTGQKLLINYVAYRCLSRDNEDPETMQMASRFLELYGMGV